MSSTASRQMTRAENGDGAPFRAGFDAARAGRRAECDGGAAVAGTRFAGRQFFAGTLTGMLVNDGLLSWNQPVVQYVPDFRLSNADSTTRLSLANLLSQSTGLTRNAYDRDIEANASYYTVRSKLAGAPLRCAPNCFRCLPRPSTDICVNTGRRSS